MSRMTIEYLGLWETLYHPDFNPTEFGRFRKEVGLNHFAIQQMRILSEVEGRKYLK